MRSRFLEPAFQDIYLPNGMDGVGGLTQPYIKAQWPETTALVAVGQTRNVELITDAPGDWAFHCHMTHHVMNQMGHQFPNMVGMKRGDLDGEDPALCCPRT